MKSKDKGRDGAMHGYVEKLKELGFRSVGGGTQLYVGISNEASGTVFTVASTQIQGIKQCFISEPMPTQGTEEFLRWQDEKAISLAKNKDYTWNR